MIKLAYLVAALTVAALPAQAFAYDWSVVGKVTYVEPSYAPNSLPFQIDNAGGNCAAGSMLTWNTQGTDEVTKIANYDAVIAVLLTAKTTGQHVVIFGENNGCTIDYVHLQ